ncbi:MAG: CRISPR-associated helicase Cas3' [Chloroflexi bacterium]|nr:CRISPR-associated helicase Cas3' [Chloroflexota bacterium]
MDFAEFFKEATENSPYSYQSLLAQADEFPILLKAPTGTGKTEAVALAWLWRRRYQPDLAARAATPRRLVYCLPMRSLVEQTKERVEKWLTNLGLSQEQVYVEVLMGGESSRTRDLGRLREWWLNPEQDGILIGTQDMLLSRALNRGYGMGHFSWPVEFGLLNNDCLWVMDEVQLMANGLPTSTQLAALRDTRNIGVFGPQHTIWMSATITSDWLRTVDFPPPSEEQVMTVDPNSLDDDRLQKRNTAVKTLHKLELEGRVGSGAFYSYDTLAARVREFHQPGTLTLIVVNTVKRAQDVFSVLKKARIEPDPILVHSRFRPAERSAVNAEIASPVPEDGPGRIVVATQAVEAGVDISVRTLITELAPWPSLVQRFGRCNREGGFDSADVHWLDVPEAKHAPPYDFGDLESARKKLSDREGQSVAPANLPPLDEKITHSVVLRRRDLIGLFDTTPDLSGNYLDVSRFVRGSDERDVQVFWREWKTDGELNDLKMPERNELCSVPIHELRDFMRKGNLNAWRWDYLEDDWREASYWEIHPGQTLLLRCEYGGYSNTGGWEPSSTSPVESLYRPENAEETDSVKTDPSSIQQRRWITLSKHSQDVRDEAKTILDALADLNMAEDVRKALLVATQWHDTGKAHPVFQEFMLSKLTDEEKPSPAGQFWAKRGTSKRPDPHRRSQFRHELASALALLDADVGLDGYAKDLAAYLAAAHHGKVRLGIRSLPLGRNQNPDHRYLLGFRIDGDGVTQQQLEQDNTLPETDLGDGVKTQRTVIDLSIAQVGVTDNGERSWLDRVLALRDMKELGPFRLAYLEALVRAADVRASIKEEMENDHTDC